MTKKTRAALLAAVAAGLVAALAPAAWAAAGVPRQAPAEAGFRHDLTSGAAYVQSPVTVQDGTGASSSLRAETYRRFDLREQGRLTQVRDQSSANTCWAFATMAALESRALAAGQTVDLSEDNLVARSGFGPFRDAYETGGNYLMAAAYLARWSGPLDEAADPYLFGGPAPAGPVTEHVQGLLLLPPRSGDDDNGAIKAALLNYGPVATVMNYPEDDATAFNAATNAFYTDKAQKPNHGVAIVGWDDDFPAGGFLVQPPGNGAFLVRNSWSAGWGDGGYFWVSYYDKTLARSDVSMAVTRVDPVGRYRRSYGYDTLGWTASAGVGSSSGSFANSFTAKASEKVRAVSFYVGGANASYTLYAGRGLGTMTAHGSGKLRDPGYVTVPLSPGLSVTRGRRFVVAVRLKVPGDTMPIPLEQRIGGYAHATAAKGQSYVRSGGRWKDLTTQRGFAEANVCLRAFTRK